MGRVVRFGARRRRAVSAEGFKRPFAHFAEPDFFGAELNAQLIDYAIAHEADFVPSLVDNDGAYRMVNPTVRVSSLLFDLGPYRAPLESAFRVAATKALRALGMTISEIAQVEIELAHHGDGAVFTRHVDNRAVRAERVLSFVYYLFREPRRFQGGQLVIHSLIGSEAGGNTVTIEPRNDLLVAFPSWAPHEVLPVTCSSRRFADARFAINCWLHRSSHQPHSAEYCRP